jgi:hypothetical protein
MHRQLPQTLSSPFDLSTDERLIIPPVKHNVKKVYLLPDRKREAVELRTSG